MTPAKAVIVVWPRNLQQVRSVIPEVRQENLVNPFGDTIAGMFTVQR